MLEIYDLKTDYSTNPINVNNTKPCFSWKYRVTDKNVNISYYQILVASSKTNLEQKNSAPIFIYSQNFFLMRYEKQLHYE